MHDVLVNRLKDLSLPRKSVVYNCWHLNIYERENSILGLSEPEKKAEFLNIFILMSISNFMLR